MKRLQGYFVALMNTLTDVRDIASANSHGNVFHDADEGH